MTVDQAAYRRFEGRILPGRGAVAAIAGTTLRRVLRRRWLRNMYGLVLVMNLVVASFLTYVLRPRIGDQSAADVAGVDPFVIVLRWFQSQVRVLAPIVAALAVAPLIAEDRKAKALPLYFARPITPLHYVLGKATAGFCFVGVLLLLPPIGMFLADLANAPDDVAILDRLDLLVRGLTPLVLLTVCLTALSLGVSSLADRTNAASLAAFGLLMLLFVAAHASVHLLFGTPEYYALDPIMCAHSLGHTLLPQSSTPQGFQLADIPEDARDLAPGVAVGAIATMTALGLAVLWGRVRRVEVVE